eukprot:scaffold48954_cov32-Tisochrysis_lutea.AAC.2
MRTSKSKNYWLRARSARKWRGADVAVKIILPNATNCMAQVQKCPNRRPPKHAVHLPRVTACAFAIHHLIHHGPGPQLLHAEGSIGLHCQSKLL